MPEPTQKPPRAMTREACTTLVVGSLGIQAIYGALRMIALAQDRTYALSAYSLDPLPDIVIDIAIVPLTLVAIALLRWRPRIGWWWSLAVLAIGCLDALRITIAPFGGPAYLPLILGRLFVVWLLLTPVVRAVYRIRDPYD